MDMTVGTESQRTDTTADGWLERVRGAERRGDFLAAYDLGQQALEFFPEDVALKHRTVLALARSGATRQAREAFLSLGLNESDEEDLAALEARLVKDDALAAAGDARSRLAGQAARLYEAIFECTGTYYPGINAATMWLLSGDRARTEDLARRVRTICRETPGEGGDTYYRAATEAEACLLLGDTDGAGAAITRAAASHGDDFAAVATTRRQLRLVCALNDLDASVLDGLATASVATFCGHIISAAGKAGRLPADAEPSVRARIGDLLDGHDVGYGYGSLAAGADILFAEALLARGAEVHIVMPFNLDEFKRVSVAGSGDGWLDRFDQTLAGASSVTYATEDFYLGDDILFVYAARTAMGMALLRARHLETDVMQLAVWDGEPAAGEAGTAADIDTWKEIGGTTHIISSTGGTGPETQGTGRPARARAESGDDRPREARAMLFGDIKGFSKLLDHQVPVFFDVIMGCIAEVLDRFGDAVMVSNTWGDGLYVVLRDPQAAADCALSLHEALAAVDLEQAGLPPHLSLRIGAHAGPVFRGYDPVLKATMFCGAHVTRTARLEPVTPEGQVYVTEQLAAMLMLAREPDYVCDYVGRIPSAKGYGSMRMYLLRRKQTKS